MNTPSWNAESARRAYAIPNWSEDFFDIGDDGRLHVRVAGAQGPSMALIQLADMARCEGQRLPLLLRFPDILRQRLRTLQNAFDEAREYYEYPGGYRPIYPIKANQQHSVVQSLVSDDGAGLEVGSKPELIAAIAMSRPGGYLICNGYKDAEYVRLALIGRRLGLRVILVIEKPGELELIAREATASGIDPEVGLRLRLSSTGKGKWQDTGGERAKFGLSASQILDLVQRMRTDGQLNWLQLLHFHMGSQISNLRDFQAGMREAGRYLAELRTLGAPLGLIDIGGGLGVDYEGSRSRTYNSMNYTVRQYAAAIVHVLSDLCREHDLTPPDIVSESGRALAAHHAVLIVPVSATEQVPVCNAVPPPGVEDEHVVLAGLRQIFNELDERSPEECWLEASHYFEEGHNRFLYGDLSLPERAALEKLYYSLLLNIRSRLAPAERKRHRELEEEFEYRLSDKYFLNLSIFQSAPDIWALDQVFPIVPLTRLDEEPTRRAVLEDLTCDSDGRIESYVDQMGVEKTLRVHPFRPDEEYLLGIFLVGAYQETLGDIHNLFGDTDSADVILRDGTFELSNLRHGDTARILLDYLGYNSADLMRACRSKIQAAQLPPSVAGPVEAALQAGLDGYTYLED